MPNSSAIDRYLTVLGAMILAALAAAPAFSQVTLYSDKNFRGTSQTFYGEVPDLRHTRIGNDRVSSIAVDRGCRVVLFADRAFRGAAIEIYGDVSNLRHTALGNDRASSLIVECDRRWHGRRTVPTEYSKRERPRISPYDRAESGGVVLFSDSHFRGRSVAIHRDVERLGRTPIGNDRLSSISVPRGCRAILYRHEDFRGASIVVGGDEHDLGRTPIGNDSVSSIAVECGRRW